MGKYVQETEELECVKKMCSQNILQIVEMIFKHTMLRIHGNFIKSEEDFIAFGMQLL